MEQILEIDVPTLLNRQAVAIPQLAQIKDQRSAEGWEYVGSVAFKAARVALAGVAEGDTLILLMTFRRRVPRPQPGGQADPEGSALAEDINEHMQRGAVA